MGPGRGSAAGSMVAYCLCITDIDPMQYNLYFERFLNPERVIHAGYRHGLLRYAAGARSWTTSRRKYGDDHVAQIVTFGTMAARARHPGCGPGAEHALCRGGRGGQAGAASALHITLDEALKLSKQLSRPL